MLTLAQWLDDCAHETQIIQHLATKIPEGALGYRPTPGQRSLLELLRYLPRMATVPMARVVDGDWRRGHALEAEVAEMEVGQFAAQMDQQLKFLKEAAQGLSPQSLDSTPCTMPWGTPCTLGEFLVNAVHKTFPVYRMQLFLYLKAAGATHLDSKDCWIGRPIS